MRTATSSLLALSLSALSACTSAPINVSPLPPAQYQVLGKAEGKACGSLGALSTAYYVIPMGLNGRMESAYQRALESVPGSTALINVSLNEDWTWWLIGTARCTTVTGDAIKEQK
jgi:hypothetical protein